MKNMKLIMESWRNFIAEDQDEDNLKYSILSQANSEAKVLVRKLEDDMDVPENQFDWVDDKIYDDLNDISFKAKDLGDLIKSVRNYFQEVGPTLGFGDLDLSGVLSELPPEVQKLMTLGESDPLGIDAAAATEAEAEEDEASGIMEKEDKDKDKDGVPAPPEWSKEPGKEAPKWADQDDNDPKVGDKLKKEIDDPATYYAKKQKECREAQAKLTAAKKKLKGMPDNSARLKQANLVQDLEKAKQRACYTGIRKK